MQAKEKKCSTFDTYVGIQRLSRNLLSTQAKNVVSLSSYVTNLSIYTHTQLET